MKFILLLASSLTFTANTFAMSVLKDAILKLPPEAVADMPLNQRQIFLDYFKEDPPEGDRRLDEKDGCLSFFTDSEDGVHFTTTSGFEVKIFHITGGRNLAFCCRTNPHGRSPTHVRGQTFIFKQSRGTWIDVTTEYLPTGISAEFFFRPRRKLAIVEGEDLNIKERNGPNTRQFDLLWNGRVFKVRKSPSSKYDEDFM